MIKDQIFASSRSAIGPAHALCCTEIHLDDLKLETREQIRVSRLQLPPAFLRIRGRLC
jgi:hypothetical protein